MTESVRALVAFEKNLSAVIRLLEERETLDGIAERCGYDLPPASWSLLEHLQARGSLRVTEIAACHGVQVSSITPRLKALESADLITRHRDDADGRVHLIEITRTGSEALRLLHESRRELLGELAGGDITPDHLATASLVLERLAGRMRDDPRLRVSS